MSDAESKVRAVWERVEVEHGGHYIYLWPNEDRGCCAVWHSWESALAFTEQRLEEIRQVEEEINWLGLRLWEDQLFAIKAAQADTEWLEREVPDHCRGKRILAAREAHIAELKRGMKAEATQ